jgi:hypothetical protein
MAEAQARMAQSLQGYWILVSQSCSRLDVREIKRRQEEGYYATNWKKVIDATEESYWVEVRAGTKCAPQSPEWDVRVHPSLYCGKGLRTEGRVSMPVPDHANFKGRIVVSDPWQSWAFPGVEPQYSDAEFERENGPLILCYPTETRLCPNGCSSTLFRMRGLKLVSS